MVFLLKEGGGDNENYRNPEEQVAIIITHIHTYLFEVFPHPMLQSIKVPRVAYSKAMAGLLSTKKKGRGRKLRK